MDNVDLLEEISLGMSHSTLGAMIGKKWRFNEALTSAIELHHRPHMAPEKLKPLVYIVYIADMFVEIDSRRSRFEFIDEDVLEFLNLTDRESFNNLHNMLRESSEDQQ
jgi:HD-like signal output (HDOD) protein